MDCNNIDTLDLRGKKYNIIINENDTLNLTLEFRDDNDIPRDMLESIIYFVINDVKVADFDNGIEITGEYNHIVNIQYEITQSIGVHQYALRMIENDIDRAELFGKLTIKDI
jgi:hypothetical protein